MVVFLIFPENRAWHHVNCPLRCLTAPSPACFEYDLMFLFNLDDSKNLTLGLSRRIQHTENGDIFFLFSQNKSLTFHTTCLGCKKSQTIFSGLNNIMKTRLFKYIENSTSRN